MRPLSEATARIAGKSFERKYIALGRIVKHWPEIVGQALADKAQPVKIHYRKKKGGQKPFATLEIACSGADSTKLHYQKTLILERMNQIFGEAWITDLKFVPIVSNVSVSKSRKSLPPLTEEQKKTLSQSVLAIEDEDMRERLLSLGEGIVKKDQS